MTFVPELFGDDVWAEHDRGASPQWPVKIAGYIRLSPEIANELRLAAMGPELGPPLPTQIKTRRRLGGHPAGTYRRPS